MYMFNPICYRFQCKYWSSWWVSNSLRDKRIQARRRENSTRVFKPYTAHSVWRIDILLIWGSTYFNFFYHSSFEFHTKRTPERLQSILTAPEPKHSSAPRLFYMHHHHLLCTQGGCGFGVVGVVGVVGCWLSTATPPSRFQICYKVSMDIYEVCWKKCVYAFAGAQSLLLHPSIHT